MNLKARHTNFKVFSGARPDIERIKEIWSECLGAYGGPFLFGKTPDLADAMYAPVCTRFRTYGVELPAPLQGYCDTIFDWPLLQEWTDGAVAEADEIDELEVEF
jgi:glutathione S-transferase